MARTNARGSETIKRFPPEVNGTYQYPPFLEQGSFPTNSYYLHSPRVMTPESSNYRSSKAQLTIFYAGMVYVNDNVPPDKVQAIMLLAQESSSSKSVTTETPVAHVMTPPVSNSRLSSICKLQGGIQMARNHSLKQFLEKRQARITNKSPCAFPIKKQENGNPTSDDCIINNETFSPATFLHI